jgi:hypothetical protein
MLNVTCSPLTMKERCLTLPKKRIVIVNTEMCKRLSSLSAVKANVCENVGNNEDNQLDATITVY